MFTPCLHSSDARMGNALQMFSLVHMSVPSIYLEIQSLCHTETSTKCSRSHFTVCNGLVIVDLLQPILGYTAHICLVRFLFNSNNFPRHFLIFYETFASHACALLFYCHSYVCEWSEMQHLSRIIDSPNKEVQFFCKFSLVASLCPLTYAQQ